MDAGEAEPIDQKARRMLGRVAWRYRFVKYCNQWSSYFAMAARRFVPRLRGPKQPGLVRPWLLAAHSTLGAQMKRPTFLCKRTEVLFSYTNSARPCRPISSRAVLELHLQNIVGASNATGANDRPYVVAKPSTGWPLAGYLPMANHELSRRRQMQLFPSNDGFSRMKWVSIYNHTYIYATPEHIKRHTHKLHTPKPPASQTHAQHTHT